MSQQIQLSERMRKFGKIFCAWNDRKYHPQMNGDYAIYEISKLFKEETMIVWNQYCNLKTDGERGLFLKEVLKVEVKS